MTLTQRDFEIIVKYLNKATTTEGHADVEDIADIGTAWNKANQILQHFIDNQE